MGDDQGAGAEGRPSLDRREREVDRALLAMLLDRAIKPHDASRETLLEFYKRLNENVYMALSLATKLGLACGIDRDGMAHLWLTNPLDDSSHVSFPIGLVKGKTPVWSLRENEDRVKAFSDAVLPPGVSRREGPNP